MLYSTPAAVLSDLMARCDSPAISFHSDLIPKRQLVENFYFGCPCVESSLRILHNFYLRYLSFLGLSELLTSLSRLKCLPRQMSNATPCLWVETEKHHQPWIEKEKWTQNRYFLYFWAERFQKKVIKRSKQFPDVSFVFFEY